MLRVIVAAGNESWAYRVHFGRRFCTTPCLYSFRRHGTVHTVGVGVMDSAHASGLSHALSPFASEHEAAPACASDQQDAAYDR